MPLKELNFNADVPGRTVKKRKLLNDFDPVAPGKRDVDPHQYNRLIHGLNLCQPDVPFLTIASPYRWGNPGGHHPPDPPSHLPNFVLPSNNILVPSAEEIVETSPPIPQTIMQATNRFLASWNDNQLSDAALSSFIISLRISIKDQEKIEEITRGQSNNQLWFQFRNGMITGSSIHDVMTRMKTIQAGKASDSDFLVRQCLGQNKFRGNKDTSYGLANEGRAAKLYYKCHFTAVHQNPTINECGLFVSENGYIGASPDRIATCSCHGKRIVEIKCPASMEKMPPGSFKKLRFLSEQDNTLSICKSHKYYSQVQCYMALTSTTHTDFVVWSPQEIITIPVLFDSDRWSCMLTKTNYFFQKFLAPALLRHKKINGRSILQKEHQCHICEGVLLDTDCILSNDDASIQCECKCECAKWFHWKCVNYKDESHETEWFCQFCQENCE